MVSILLYLPPSLFVNCPDIFVGRYAGSPVPRAGNLATKRCAPAQRLVKGRLGKDCGCAHFEEGHTSDGFKKYSFHLYRFPPFDFQDSFKLNSEEKHWT